MTTTTRDIIYLETAWMPTPHLRRVLHYTGDDHIRYELEQKWERQVNHGYGAGAEMEYEWRPIPIAQ